MQRATEPGQPESEQRSEAAHNGSHASKLFLSPFLWGGLLTVGFYQLIPYLPLHQALLQRYFCGHPLEYATATLFFVGMAILGLKAIRVTSEKAALDLDLLNEEQLVAEDTLQRAALLEERTARLAGGLSQTHLVRRIRDVCAYIRGRRSTSGLEEHLKYLADLAAERLHSSYALVRTITWAVPIIGFLGTVIGITMAIANVTPEQLDSSLTDVTSGLAVAFDTTALALALSLVLVFGSFLTERAEQKILAQVEELGVKQLGALFPEEPQAGHPLADAEIRASRHLIEKTESLINWQTQVWQEGVDALRQRWIQTLQNQQSSLDEAVRQGLSASLGDHDRQLGEVRSEFLQAFQLVSKQLADSQSEALQTQQRVQDEFQRQMAELWQQVRSDFAALREEQAARMQELMKSLAQNVGGWQSQLRSASQAGAAQLEELRRQGETLRKVVESEEQLARLQKRLVENLEAVRAADTFEETLHSLSAAVQLLAARAKPKAA